MGQKVQGSSSFSSTARDASELAALQQQALTLRSRTSSGAEKLRGLLRCSKLQSWTSSGVCCVAAASSHALELAVATQQALMLWSLLRCSKQAPEVAVATQQALTLRSRTSSRAWCVAGFSCSKQAPKPRSFGEAPELGACLPLQTKQRKIK